MDENKPRRKAEISALRRKINCIFCTSVFAHPCDSVHSAYALSVPLSASLCEALVVFFVLAPREWPRYADRSHCANRPSRANAPRSYPSAVLTPNNPPYIPSLPLSTLAGKDNINKALEQCEYGVLLCSSQKPNDDHAQACLYEIRPNRAPARLIVSIIVTGSQL